MRNYYYEDNGKRYERVNKKIAEQYYLAGRQVTVCPVNLRPGAPYYPEVTLDRKSREEFVVDETGVKNDFHNQVASFEYYNCPNTETGKYAAFYIQLP